jgi:hypothetical protein
MWALRLAKPADPFLSPNADAVLKANVETLANGIFDPRAKAFVEERAMHAPKVRLGPVIQLRLRPDVKEQLRNVSNRDLGTWLNSEILTSRGVALLADHVRRQFPEALPQDARDWAAALLKSPNSRLSAALVRADLYYNWRCAHRGSNPKDLFDDMYHVLNAIYCDVYATKERRHGQYAELLLTTHTRVAIYDGHTPLNSWIVELPQIQRE